MRTSATGDGNNHGPTMIVGLREYTVGGIRLICDNGDMPHDGREHMRGCPTQKV